MMMKRLIVMAFLGLGMMNTQVKAQDAAAEPVTEEEIMKFATMEESVAHFLKEKQDALVEMVKTDAILGGPARYNEIKAAWGKDDKLAEIKITDDERAAYQKIQDYINSMSDQVKEFKLSQIKNPEVLGAATYNKVNKAMNADPELKKKVNEAIAMLKEKRAAAGGGSAN
jgi:hypothetical protein